MQFIPSSPVGEARYASPSPYPDRLLRLEQVKAMVGLGKTLIYRLIAAGDFPIPYKPGGSVARWSENEIVEWLAQCAARRVQ